MKLRLALLALTLAVSNVPCFADWRTLKNTKGDIVEITVDFEIEDLRIEADGASSFKAKASMDGAEISFRASLSKPQEGTIGIVQQSQRIQILRTDIAITSSGAATSNLERRLNEQLLNLGQPKEAYRVAAPRSGYSALLAGSLAAPAMFHASSVGLVYNDQGESVLGNALDIQLVIDAPLGRLTVHFYASASYGGSPDNEATRNDWFKRHQKEPQKKSASIPDTHRPIGMGKTFRPARSYEAPATDRSSLHLLEEPDRS